MHRLLVTVLLFSPLSHGAGAQEWRGRLICDPLPGLTQTPLNMPLTVAVTDGVARYERILLTPHGQPTGWAERGEGRVAADGSLTLEGLATGRGIHFTARYAGRLGADGRARLEGKQDWWSNGIAGQQSRPCRVTLRRQDGG